MPSLRAEVLTVDDISARLRDTMYQVYSSYFQATDRTRFEQDLAGKTHTVFLYDQSAALRGFSTLALYPFSLNDSLCQIVFSGDTIVHHEYWGQQLLPMKWIELTGVFKSQQPEAPLYWFLIVKGYRTYRYLPLFAKQYYPTHREETPAHLQSLLDELARSRFGDCYDAECGVIRFGESRGHLAPEWARVPERVADRPDVQFFLQHNPGHVRGDELACITELSVDNLRRRARAYFERGLAQ
jgi:hypothetical protein